MKNILYLKEGEVQSSKSQFFLVTWAVFFSPLDLFIYPTSLPTFVTVSTPGTKWQNNREREIFKKSCFCHLSGITAVLMREEGSALSELWLLWALFAISAITVMRVFWGWGMRVGGGGNFIEVEDGKVTTDWMVFKILVFSSNLPAIIFFQSLKYLTQAFCPDFIVVFRGINTFMYAFFIISRIKSASDIFLARKNPPE